MTVVWYDLLRYLLQLRFSFQFHGALYPISWKTKFRGQVTWNTATLCSLQQEFDLHSFKWENYAAVVRAVKDAGVK